MVRHLLFVPEDSTKNRSALSPVLWPRAMLGWSIARTLKRMNLRIEGAIAACQQPCIGLE
jgi:hypothetical protein